MLKNNKKTPLTIKFILALASAILFSSLSSNVFATTFPGSWKTAEQKLYYRALYDCIVHDTSWWDKGYGYEDGKSYMKASSQDFKDNEWFGSNILAHYERDVTGGAWVKHNVTGDREGDGVFICGWNWDDLVRNTLEVLGISNYEMACKNDNETGMLYDNGEHRCKRIYEEYNEFWLKDGEGRGNYFWEITQEKTKDSSGEAFSGTGPEFTEIEKYFVALRSFGVACTAGSPDPDFNGGYRINVWDDSTAKFQSMGYEKRGDISDNTKVVLYNGWEDTCGGLAGRLGNKDDSLIKAFYDYYRDDCNSQVTDAWDFEYNKALFVSGQSKFKEDQPVEITPDGIFPIISDTSTATGGFKEDRMEPGGGSSGSTSSWSSGDFKEQRMEEDIEGASDVSYDTLSSGKRTSWQEKGLYFKNFTETTNEDGEKEYTVDKFSQSEKDKAKKLIDEYNKYNGNYFNEDTFECKSAEGHTYTSTTNISSGSIDSAPSCYTGAGALGWILCPILYGIGDAVDAAYKNYIEPALQIQPVLLGGENDAQNKATYDAWSNFRTIANTIFIILLLAVIFSQLTGYGIDNYGIKKILPKLIIMAVLVNLSFLICQIAVDLSNILGTGLNNLMSGMGNNVTVNITDVGESSASVSVGATVLVGVGILVGILAVYSAGIGILLPLFLGAISLAISIAFLFVLLAARQAGVVVLVVLSPVAFVCYMLPNTKKLFDKWQKAFTGLLLLYPICGLLVGGGDFVSKLLLATSGGNVNFFFGLMAMIVSFVPIFFIPTLLKGSFAALGNIGATISGLGNRMRGGITKGIRNTDGFKNAQRMASERRIKKRAGYDEKTGELNRKGRLRAKFADSKYGKKIGYGRLQSSRIESAKKIADANESASASLTTALSSSGIAAKGGDAIEYYKEALTKAGNSGNVGDINAAIAAMVGSGHLKEKDISDLVAKAINNNEIKIENDGTMASFLRGLHAKYGSGFLSTHSELKDFAAKGGMYEGKRMELGEYGEYATKYMSKDDIKREDINKLSGASLAGLIKAGIIDQGMAQQMLEMNPNISNDKRLMLGAAANGLTIGGTVIDGMSAEAFKQAAKDVANDLSEATSKLGMDQKMAEALVAPTPQQVNIVQNFQGGGRQFDPVDINIPRPKDGETYGGGAGI